MRLSLGDKVKVQSTHSTRTYGIMWGTRDQNQRAWPGMIGVVNAISWLDMDNNQVYAIELCFPGIPPYPIDPDGTFDREGLVVI